ncbi:Transposase IS116/IS110/IS902 family protein [Pseudovibrio sp. Ad5]|nr:Transposase IS116/IS110/IS902 family protein [Pseudovibrio sp. Ad5]
MGEVHFIGIDLAKAVFHLHGAGRDGSIIFRKKLSRSRVLEFLSKWDKCTVAMEACATAHFWGREIAKLGHEVKLIPPVYVKPFVKRQKNDTNDAEAIAEAAVRPTMRFVAVKSADQQGLGTVFRSRDLLVRQRTQLMNSLRAHLAEFGIVSAKGTEAFKALIAAAHSAKTSLPDDVWEIMGLYVSGIAECTTKITVLEKKIKLRTRQDRLTKRLQTMPGVGPMTAAAIQAFAPSLDSFESGRDFASWLGLVPKQHSTGGKARLGRISKMGQQDIRRLLINGAMSLINATLDLESFETSDLRLFWIENPDLWRL